MSRTPHRLPQALLSPGASKSAASRRPEIGAGCGPTGPHRRHGDENGERWRLSACGPAALRRVPGQGEALELPGGRKQARTRPGPDATTGRAGGRACLSRSLLLPLPPSLCTAAFEARLGFSFSCSLSKAFGEVQVLTAKSDVDGALEAQLAFLTRGGHRLFYLNEEASFLMLSASYAR